MASELTDKERRCLAYLAGVFLAKAAEIGKVSAPGQAHTEAEYERIGHRVAWALSRKDRFFVALLSDLETYVITDAGRTALASETGGERG